MAIITLPTGLEFSRLDWRLVEGVQVNRSSWSNNRRVHDLDNGYFAASAAILPVGREVDKRKWRAFAAKLRGPANTFRLPVAQCDQAAGNLTVTSAAAAGATAVAVSGPASMALKAGQYLTAVFETNVEQLLILSADVTLSGGGAGTVQFEPATRAALGIGDAMLAVRPTGLVALVQGAPDPEQVDGVLTWGFEAEEAF